MVRAKTSPDVEPVRDKTDESFFVRISDPQELRREVLESSKLMIHVLQSEKKLEDIREEKARVITEFKKHIKEMNLIIAKIKKRLPRTKLRALTKEEQLEVYKKGLADTQHKGAKKAPPKEIVVAPKKTEVDALKSQLDDIESKLRSI
ncbi:hypothetical protein JXM83_02895 [Candidatus Woesearchaeota archaeon]|nr:hypothetical protein [Candidatus Woesearchaeota archaeon]